MSTKRAALLVGLNYTDTPRLRLNGCWNDAIGIGSLLTSSYGFDTEDVDVVLDLKREGVAAAAQSRTSRTALTTSLAALARRSWADDGPGVVVFTFSGHGSQQKDVNGDEADGLDEGICPSDCMRSGLIVDDEINLILRRFSPKTRVYTVFDCCHSGSIVDLPYQYPTAPDKGPVGGVVPLESSPTIVSLSGCRDSQTSADAYNRSTNQFGGALTMALLAVLQQPGGSSLGLFALHARIVAILAGQRHTQYPLISSSHPISDDCRMFA
jgi:hypothetical protein